MAEIDLAGDRPAGDVDYHHLLSVGTGLTHAGAAIDRHIDSPAVRRGSYLVAGNPALGHSRHLLGRNRVNDADVPVALVRGYQQRRGRARRNGGGFHHEHRQRQDQAEHQAEEHQSGLIHSARIIYL